MRGSWSRAATPTSGRASSSTRSRTPARPTRAARRRDSVRWARRSRRSSRRDPSCVDDDAHPAIGGSAETLGGDARPRSGAGQRVPPAQSRVAGEVGIGRLELEPPLDRERGDVRVRDVVAGRPAVGEQAPQKLRVTVGRRGHRTFGRSDVRARWPPRSTRFACRGAFEDPRMGREAVEREDRRPGETDERRLGQRPRPPRARLLVPGELAVVRPQHEIRVDEDRLAGGRFSQARPRARAPGRRR
jgi:hypothetical protein